MQTECPHCHSLFHITETDLEQADGQVQCGHCLAIFSAENPYLSPLNDEDEAENTGEDTKDTNDKQDLFDTEIDATDIIPPELRVDTAHTTTRYSFLGSVLWSLGILFLIFAGLAQYAYFQRDELVKYSRLQAPMKIFCHYAQCDLPAPRDTQRIKLSSKNVYTHPNIDKALMINASIVNQAEFSQAFPILEIRFENIRGETIAARRFTPAEYLNIPAEQISAMQPGEPVSFNIEIIDPGTDVVSYAFEFL